MNAAKFQMLLDAPESAPWLVMVHGLSQHSGLFSAQLAAFSQKYRILVVDLPGHGRSSDLPGPYGQVEYFASVGSALRAAGIARFHYWGTHTGAAVGLLLALDDCQRPLSLILEGAVVPGEPMPYVSRQILQARRTASSKGPRAAIREWYETAAWFDAIRIDPVVRRGAEHWAMLMDFNGAPWLDKQLSATPPRVRDRLGELHIPTLLINGENDLPEFLRTADLLARELPNATRVTIPSAGGFPQWERPDVVNRTVLDFLALHPAKLDFSDNG